MKAFLESVHRLEAIFSESAALADTPDNRRRSIKLRRDVSEELATIELTSRSAFSDEKASFAYRHEYALMRSAITAHFASWPISTIDLSNEAYLVSIRQMRLACSRFFGWLNAVVDRGQER